MCAQRQGPDANDVVFEALQKLRQAEAELLAAMQPGDHPHNVVLLEVHAFLWEAISKLSEITSKNKSEG
jgi:hypothetical protein